VLQHTDTVKDRWK